MQMPGWTRFELWWYYDILIFAFVILALTAAIVGPMSFLVVRDVLKLRAQLLANRQLIPPPDAVN